MTSKNEKQCQFCGVPVRRGRWCSQFCADKWRETEPPLVDKSHASQVVHWTRLGRPEWNRGWMKKRFL
jgi:hypothetical protein